MPLGNLFGIILAGGQGRRMGGADKALVLLQGRPLLAHVAERLAPQVNQMALSANGDAARFAGFGLPVLADGLGVGPLAGVLSGLHWAKAQGAEALLTVAVDSPFFPDDLAARLKPGPAVASHQGRLHPTFALWPVGLVELLAGQLAQGQARLRDFAALAEARVQGFDDVPDDPFRNLNTLADLALAEGVRE